MPSWSLLSYIPVSHSPKSLLFSAPAHPPTSQSYLELYSAMDCSLEEIIVVQCLTGPPWLKAAQSQPQARVASTSAANTLLLSSYATSQSLIAGVLAIPQVPPPTPLLLSCSRYSCCPSRLHWLCLEDIDINY